MNGFELLRALRADPFTSEIPILMLTARSSVENETEGLATGADDYVAKPVEPRRLAARVKSLLRRTGRGGPAAARPRRGAADGAEPGAEWGRQCHDAHPDRGRFQDDEADHPQRPQFLGFTAVDEVPTGAEALAKIGAGGFDLVISDWSMPQMSGLELLRAIRADAAHASCPS